MQRPPSVENPDLCHLRPICGTLSASFMPSHLHDALVELVREQPRFAAHLLRSVIGLEEIGEPVLRKSSESATDLQPPELRTDAVFELRDRAGNLQRAVIFEVQLEWSADKRYSWPAYLAVLRRQLRCPVALVILTMKASVARRLSEPIDLDGVGGSRVTPLVVGPTDVPVVMDQDRADAMPELAVLSVVAHADTPQAAEIGRCALAASAKLDDHRAAFYADIVFAYISEAARVHLEAIMGLENYKFQSDFAKRFVAEGLAEGLAKGLAEGLTKGEAKGRQSTLLAILDARGLVLSETQLARIEACADIEVLERWARAAAVATSTDLIFEGDT